MKKVVLLSAALLVAGCGEKSNEEKLDIIGKWVVREQAGIKFTNDKNWYHFMDDGKVVMNTWSPLTPADGTSSNGTWKLEGNVITTIFSGHFDGEPVQTNYASVIKSIESGRMVVSMEFLAEIHLESGVPYGAEGSEGIETVLEKE